MTEHATADVSAATTTVPATAATPGTTSRRRVLATSGVVAAAAVVTAACGSSGDTGSTGSSAGTGATEPAGEAASTAKADVPVGGGVILPARKVVITQPAAGTFKGFSAVCTHQGCVVSSVADGTITCACHGSTFSADDGSVQSGPATAGLAPVDVTVSGDQITVA